MAEHQIRFDDGAAYERMMGAWSRLAGKIFLDWITLRPGLRWVDVGCGNGAFTELIVEKVRTRKPGDLHEHAPLKSSRRQSDPQSVCRISNVGVVTIAVRGPRIARVILPGPGPNDMRHAVAPDPR
jgi:hypothetical protein